MKIATWNLNNRVGKVRFRPEAANAAMALGVDVLVFTEFYPQLHEKQFRDTLSSAGWTEQLMSPTPTEVANRILIASKLPVMPLQIEFPAFDQQFPANLAAVSIPSIGLSVVGVRVPAYSALESSLLRQAWDWLETTAALLSGYPSVILGDLNVSTASTPSRGGDQFRRILANGWKRASPTEGATFFGHNGRTSEIDHILASNHCILSEAICIKSAGGFALCDSQDAISDHAALLCQIEPRLP